MIGAAVTERALVLVRHGATEWSRNGRHTGTTDLPLLPEGEKKAAELAPVLALMAPVRVLCSPRLRARDTCVLGGFGERMEIVDDLAANMETVQRATSATSEAVRNRYFPTNALPVWVGEMS